MIAVSPDTPVVKWFHVLTDPRTGTMYPTVKVMPDEVLELGMVRVMEALKRHRPKGCLDVALDCYNAWKQELERRQMMRELDLTP